ncbi:hypothetical protein HZC07_03625 [Candidatus Micrarchaeota archaeon]|nr:hypothetical protein [Candidatus Micrarchaeota archaeon]
MRSRLFGPVLLTLVFCSHLSSVLPVRSVPLAHCVDQVASKKPFRSTNTVLAEHRFGRDDFLRMQPMLLESVVFSVRSGDWANAGILRIVVDKVDCQGVSFRVEEVHEDNTIHILDRFSVSFRKRFFADRAILDLFGIDRFQLSYNEPYSILTLSGTNSKWRME